MWSINKMAAICFVAILAVPSIIHTPSNIKNVKTQIYFHKPSRNTSLM